MTPETPIPLIDKESLAAAVTPAAPEIPPVPPPVAPTTSPNPEKKARGNSWGGIIGIFLIVFLIITAAFYSWGERLATQTPTVDTTVAE